MPDNAQVVKAHLEMTATGKDEAAQQLHQVAEEMEHVKESADAISESGKAAQEASKGLNNALKGTSKAADAAGRSASKASTFFHKLGRSFARIIFYRAIRKTLSEIASGAKEGITNLTEYSNALNGADASNVVYAMNQISSASLYLKNCLGAVLAPIISMLGARVRSLAEAFAWVTNKIAQFFAVLNGQRTFTAAKWAEKQTGAIASNTASAAESAKELQRTLLGFDEINKLDAPDKGSSAGGGGGGVSADGFGDMFEELPISDAMFERVEKIKKVLLDLTAFIGLVLVALGVIMMFLGHIGIGIAMVVSGIAITAFAIHEIKIADTVEKELSLVNSIVAGLLVAIGVILLVLGAVPVGIGCIVAGITIVAYEIANDVLPKDVQQTLNKVMTVVSPLLAIIGIVLVCFQMYAIGIPLICAGIAGLFAISNTPSDGSQLHDKVKKALKSVFDVITGVTGVALGIFLCCTGVGLPLGLGLILQNADSLATTFTGDGGNKLSQFIIDTLKKVGIDVNTEAGHVGIQIVAGILEGITKKLDSDGSSFFSKLVKRFVDWLKDKFGIHSPAKTMIPIGENIVKGLTNPFKNLWKNIKGDISDFKKNIKEKFSDIKTSVVNSFSKMKDGAVGKLGGIESNALSVKNSINKYFAGLKLKFKKPVLTWTTKPASGWIATTLSALGIPTQLPKLNVEWKANGGFVNAGQLFVARESGPEMVGSMNGRTAVANNDQIVQGIASGVYEAMMRANANGGQQTSVYVDGKALFDIMVGRNNSVVSRTGKSPLKV